MQAVTQIAASCHISAGMLVIGQIEISSEVGEFVRRAEEDGVAFVVVICWRCLAFGGSCEFDGRLTDVFCSLMRRVHGADRREGNIFARWWSNGGFGDAVSSLTTPKSDPCWSEDQRYKCDGLAVGAC